MHKIILALAVLLVLFPLVFSGDCSSPYFKSVACFDLNHYFDFNGFVSNPLNTTFITASGELDWNNLDGGSELSSSNALFDSNLVGLWHFNGNALDSSGNGIDGTTNNFDGDETTRGLFGSNAYDFDGTNDHITFGTSTLTSGATTISFWYNYDTGDGYIADLKVGGASGAFFAATNSSICWAFRGVSGTICGAINVSGWTHALITYNGGTTSDVGNYAIYINGRSIPLTNYGSQGGSTSINYLGYVVGGTYFNGKIEELAIWNKALTSDEAQVVYDSQKKNWLDENLIAYYKFNEASGTTIYDSARGHNGTLTNGASVNAKGMWDTNALILDASNDFVNVTGGIDNNFFNGSISVWFKTTNKSNNRYIFEATNTTPSEGIYVYINITTGKLGFYGANDGSAIFDILSNKDMTDGQWHHAIGVWDNTQASLYIDGLLQTDSESGDNTLDMQAPFTRTLIGSYNGGYNFGGSIDELKIYDRALTEEEILYDYNNFLNNKFVADENAIIHAVDNSLRDWNYFKINESLYYDFGKEMQSHFDGTSKTNELTSASSLFDSNLVGLWHLNGNALDSSGSGNNGSWGGSEEYTTGLWDTNCGDFDGVSNYITVSNDSSIDFADEDFSVSAWINVNSFPNVGQFIVGKNYGSTGVKWYALSVTNVGELYFSIDDGTNIVTAQSKTGTIEIGKWYHILGQRDTSASKVRLYINGIDINSLSESAVGSISNNGPFVIGARADLSSSRFYDGKIEEVTIWNKALSTTEIQSLYNSQASQFHEPDINVLYHFNGNALDSSGSGYHGTLVNFGGDENVSCLWDTNCFSYGGTNEYIQTTFQPQYVKSDSTGFSHSLWFRKPYSGNWEYMLGVAAQAPSLYYLFSNVGILQVGFSTNETSTVCNMYTPYRVDDNLWHNIIFTRGGAQGATAHNLYLDGVWVDSEWYQGNCDENMYFQEPFYFGNRNPSGGEPTNNWFVGEIEDFVVWNRKLTEQDVVEIYRKGISKLDLNVYSCSDASCSTKTDSEYFSDVNNNSNLNLANLNPSAYLGYETYFKPISTFQDYNAGRFFVLSYLSDVSVDSTTGNTVPVATIDFIEGSSASGALPYYSFIQDGTIDVNFSVTDDDNNPLTANFYFTDSLVENTSGTLMTTIDLNTDYCDSADLTLDVNCYYDINSLIASDGNYYLKIIVNDGYSNDYAFSSEFGLDNSAPTITTTNTHNDWNREKARVTFTCSDAGSGCDLTTYRINGGLWNTYSSAISISGDGNYQIDFNAVDAKGNVSDLNSLNVLVGFNGLLKTFNDENKPRSFFGAGERVELIFDVNLNVAPTISIIDSNNAEVISGTMTNISQDTNLGRNDLNTYYYEFDVNGAQGWYDAQVQNQLFEDAFYQSNIWVDAYTSNDGNVFPFSLDLNVYEPNIQQRWFYPIDTNIPFTFGTKLKSIRVLDFNGTHYKEIPAEIYSPVYSGQNISQANIVFLSSLDQNEIRNYFVSYSIVDINKEYLTDLNANWNSYELDINSSNYFVQFDVNKGAAIELLRSRKGTNSGLNFGNEFDRAPMIDSDLSSNTYITSITAPSYTITAGNLIYKLNTSSLISFADYNLNYTIYAKSPYFLQDINIVSRGAVYWDDYIDTNPRIIPNKFEKYSYLQNNSLLTQDINALGNAKSLSDINYLVVYNKQLDSFGQIFLETDSSKAESQNIAFRDLSNSLYWENTLLTVQNMATGDYVHTKKAIVLSNPLNGAEDINKIFTSLANPLTIIVGNTTTNDSGSPPTNISIAYSPTDINSNTDVNCYSSWQDDTIINTIILNVSGPNTDVNYSFSVLDANAFVSQLISSTYINAGDYNCNFIATDAAGNTDSNYVSFSAMDISAPDIYSVINTPDGNADIDIDSNIVVDANIAEYTGLNSVTLYYRDLNADAVSGWNEWQTTAMNNDENYSDTNYGYSANFIATENIWQYFINAIDSNELDSNSNVVTLYAYDDYTWEFTPSSFGTKSGPLLQNITVGNLTINNSGDYALSFKLSSNWDDKYAIWYDDIEETTSGYAFSIASGASEIIAVKVKAKPTGKTDALTINVDATTALASPSIDYSTATIVSLSEEPALYLELVSTNNSATQGDTNVYYSARITNVGQQNATNVFFDWNYPSDWVINSGVESLSGFSLSSSSSYLSTISFNVSSSATTGNQTITFGAGCCSDLNKNQSTSTTTSVVAYSSGTGDTGDIGNTGGTSGGPDGSGASGSSGGSIFVGTQADLFFQTNEFFELVRGEDNSFPIKFTNPLKNKLIDIELSVEGIISKYLRLKNSSINSLDSNEEFSTSIEIISPKYFTPGIYSLNFIIKGILLDDYNRETNFIEEREISLLIHDTNKETAELYIVEMEKFLLDLNEFNLSLNDLPKLIEKSKNSLENNQFDEVAKIFDEVKKTYDSAIEARVKSGQITGLVGFANSKGIETPNTDRLLMLAQLALQRGDYALALSRLKEAELMYSLETKGEFNFVIWALANFDKLLLMAGLFLVAMYMFALGIKIIIIKRKLKLLASENNLLLSLIKNLQNQCFVENKISIGEYYDALTQYEERMAIVSEDMIEYTSRKNNLLKFSASAKRLEQERLSLLDLIKETQKQYFEMGLIETRIYTTKLNSLTRRLSEVQEKIVSLELRKTQRLNEGIKKYFWIIVYRIMK